MKEFLFFIILATSLCGGSLPIPNVFGLGTPCEDHLNENSCVPYCACAWEIESELCVDRSSAEGEVESLTPCDHNTIIVGASALTLVVCCCLVLFCCICCCLGCVCSCVGWKKKKSIIRRIEKQDLFDRGSRTFDPDDYEMDDR